MLDQIRTFITEELLGGREIAADENLLLSGLVDSLGVMRLVAFLERRFGISIPARDLKLANFATLEAIAGYVARRQAE
jgi:Acyl carrier protein